MERTPNDTPDGSRDEERPGGAEPAGRSGEMPAGEHRTTVEAETERLRAAERFQAEHPDRFGLRGRATGEPPVSADDAASDPRDPTT